MQFGQPLNIISVVNALTSADEYINKDLMKPLGPINIVSECSWVSPKASEYKKYAQQHAKDNYQAFIERAAKALAIPAEERSEENWRDIGLAQAIVEIALKRLGVVIIDSRQRLEAICGEAKKWSEPNTPISRYEMHTVIPSAPVFKERLSKLTTLFSDILHWASQVGFSLFRDFDDIHQLYVNLKVDPEEISRFPHGVSGEIFA